MDYKRLVIHPLGDPEVVNPIIGAVVEKCNGIFNQRMLCGMLSYYADFPNGENAQDCMGLLQRMEEVSHVEWVETS